MRRGLVCGLSFAAAAFTLSAAAHAAAPKGRTEVVVTLDAPPLADAISNSRVLTKAARSRRVDLRTPMSVGYLRGLAAAQRTLQARIEQAIPAARVTWRYSVVLDALAVDLPRRDVHKLSRLGGIAQVYPSVRYHALRATRSTRYESPELIGADAVWGSSLSTAGNGLKIGIVDDGVDQTHPFFSPSGFAMPPGFPKGNTAFTTSKVIVARAFPPPSAKWRYANRPFDPDMSEHATHVAGIAAGDHAIHAVGTTISGVAPKAYIGNYKVYTTPTASGVGLDGNAPEVAAGIEAAVADGMDVINLSIGEPEIAPSRDLVVKAVNGAAAAGVVPAIAAGNDFDGFGRGSVSSPGSAARAITTAAAGANRVIAYFSSSGPTPVSLTMKPDVTAPGVNVLSSVPRGDGLWQSFSGTSMAAPHVAGAAAILRERHPSWTVQQIKSALVLTGTPVYASTPGGAEAAPTREGGGMISVPAADDPKIFASPTGLSFGLLRPGRGGAHSIALTNAGGGAGNWKVSIEEHGAPGNVRVDAPASVSVPGNLQVAAGVGPNVQPADVSGFVVLTRNGVARRIPFWFRVSSPKLGRERHGTLRRTGTYRGNTAGKPALVTTYRYPDDPSGAGLPATLAGPEQVFTVRLKRRVANFGVAILSHGRGVSIQPRVVFHDVEDHLVGYTGLPINLNPYVENFLKPEPAAGAVLPTAGSYDVVFDTRSRARGGRFTFRFWIGDVTRPSARLLKRTITPRGAVRLRVVDRGSGVDPDSLGATIDGRGADASFVRGRALATVQHGALARGVHRLVFRVSDYQETRNMEDIGPILPNTRILTTTFRVR